MIQQAIKQAIEFTSRHKKRVFFPTFWADFRTERDAEFAMLTVIEVLESLGRSLETGPIFPQEDEPNK